MLVLRLSKVVLEKTGIYFYLNHCVTCFLSKYKCIYQNYLIIVKTNIDKHVYNPRGTLDEAFVQFLQLQSLSCKYNGHFIYFRKNAFRALVYSLTFKLDHLFSFTFLLFFHILLSLFLGGC